MSRMYKLKHFLRFVDENLLLEYLKTTGVNTTSLPKPEDKEERPGYWQRVLLTLPSDKLDQVEGGFREINDMAFESGILWLNAMAKNADVELPKEIENLPNPINQALHTYMKYPAIFNDAATQYYMVDIKAKKERVGLRVRSVAEIMERKDILADVLKGYLLEEDGRGRRCQVDVHINQKQVTFIAYPEDFIKTELEYKNGKLEKESRRPSFQITYVYHADSGRLGLCAKGGADREQALMEIFNTAVLEDKNPLPARQKVFDLDRFLDRNFELVHDLEDGIEKITVKELRLVHRHIPKFKISFEVSEQDGLKAMQEFVFKHGINPELWEVRRASVQIKFPGKGRKGGVTIQITAPDKCNLNDTPLHQKAKKYLSKWGLENQVPSLQAV